MLARALSLITVNCLESHLTQRYPLRNQDYLGTSALVTLATQSWASTAKKVTPAHGPMLAITMSKFIHCLINEANDYDRKDEMKQLWEIYESWRTGISYFDKIHPFELWLEDTLDTIGIPKGPFRDWYIDDVMDDLPKIMETIRVNGKPEEECQGCGCRHY